MDFKTRMNISEWRKVIKDGPTSFLSGLGFFIFICSQLVNRVQAQQTTQAPNSTEHQDSNLVLTELWTNNFEKNTIIQSAYILLDSEQKLKNIEVNANQLEKSNNIWRPTTFSYDFNGTRKEKSHLDDDYAYITSNGKRISFRSTGWKLEDSEGNLIHQSSEKLLKENLLFAPDDSLMMGFDDEGLNAALYDSEGKVIKKIEGEVHNVCFSPDGQFIGLIFRNPHTPKLGEKFCLLDLNGNTIFELPLDAQVKGCLFNEDGTRIAVATLKSLFLTDLKGNVIRKIDQPRGGLGLPVFINPNLFVTTGSSNVLKVDMSSSTTKVESIQKIKYPGSIVKIGNNFAIIYGIGKTGANPGTNRGLEIINPMGQILASKELPSTLGGIQVKGKYIVVWSCCSLSLFKVSQE